MLTKKIFDLVFSLLLIIILLIPILIILICIRATSPGPAIYWSSRVGKNNVIFSMPKFRTMKFDAPQLATHLMKDSKKFITPIGGFLRRYSLDELPQLFSIIKGDMSFVGPRPALFNQEDLISYRTDADIHKLLPGITGWAQINGRDNMTIIRKVDLDLEYMMRQSFWFDFKILLKTISKVSSKENVSH